MNKKRKNHLVGMVNQSQIIIGKNPGNNSTYFLN